MEQSWYMDAIRGLFSLLDRFIYGTFIPMFYDFMILLSDINVFEGGTVQDFATRMYSLLAIFMLFKISFSFITYIVNPEQMMDKAKGAGSIVKNVIIVLILIIVCPRAFSLLREVQSAILKDQVIPKFILGFDSTDELNGGMAFEYYNAEKHTYCDSGSSKNAASTGDYISLMIFKNFYNGEERSGLEDSHIHAVLNNTGFCKVNNVDAYDLLKSEVYNSYTSNTYVINYWILISTAVGVVVALLLLTSCFDIAVRSIKLGFLEIISPIPIISYIDPNSGKNGMFKKWLSEVGKTWASLFIRLVALFFAVYVISQLQFLNWNSYKGFTDEYGYFAELFIIIGALMFAKQLPKLIETLTGLSTGGGFQLNPLKKIANEAMGGKLIAGTATAAGGAALMGGAQALSNAVAFGRQKYNLRKQIASLDDKNPDDRKKLEKLQPQYDRMGFKRLASTVSGGAFGGARNGMMSGYKTGQKGSANVFGNIKGDLDKGNAARNNRTAIRDYNNSVDEKDRYGWFERNVTERVDRYTGVKNDDAGYGYYDKRIKELERKISDNNDAEAALRTGIANYCINNGINQTLVEELHKMTKGVAKDANEMIEKFEKAVSDLKTKDEKDIFYNSYNLSPDTYRGEIENLFTAYDSNLRSSLKTINDINASTREMKAEKKQYEEIANTRRNIEKK